MITCVNPRPEDYDETISILGNASIACTIREIVDVTKNAPPPPRSMLEKFSRVAKEVAVLESKKRKAEAPGGHKTQPSQDLATKVSKLSDLISAPAPATGNIGGVVVDDTTSATTSINYKALVESSDSSTADEQEVKRLRVEVEKLQEENTSLMDRLVSVEQEVRMEVAEELAKFAKIGEEHSASFQPDVVVVRECPKSTTKMKKQHLEDAWKERLADVKELEDELEGVRSEYNLKILELTSENEELRHEVDVWRCKYETLLTLQASPKITSAISTSPGKCSGSVVITNTINSSNNSNSSAADSFNQRMARFKKNASNAVANGIAFAGENLKPVVMAVIKEDAENDEMFDENGRKTTSSGVKHTVHSSGGPAGTAGLRLRSQTLRGIQ